jgi:hypothetical protein
MDVKRKEFAPQRVGAGVLLIGSLDLFFNVLLPLFPVTSSEFRMFVIYKRLNGRGIIREPSA